MSNTVIVDNVEYVYRDAAMLRKAIENGLCSHRLASHAEIIIDHNHNVVLKDRHTGEIG